MADPSDDGATRVQTKTPTTKRSGINGASSAYAPRSARRMPPPKRPAAPDGYTLHLESRLEELLAALSSAKDGDFSVRVQRDGRTIMTDVGIAFNELVERADTVTQELARVSRVVGREGSGMEPASAGKLQGSWATSIESFNS